MANLLGKRMTCRSCGAQLMIIKSGEGLVGCCGLAMEVLSAKPLPSAD